MMMRFFFVCALAATGILAATAEMTIEYRGEGMANGGRGKFAPFYMASNRHGIITQAKDVMFRASVWKPLDADSGRFSYGFGVDALGGHGSAVAYDRYNQAGVVVANGQRPPSVWLQQLYASIRYRRFYLTIGMEEQGSALLNDRLSSGDMTESANARPIPQVRVGFVDFVDVPFTKGWLQVNGVIAFGRFMDGTWLENHTNRNGFITTGALYHYKRLYFRIAPQQQLSLTVGMQAGAQISGTKIHWSRGEQTSVDKKSFRLKDLWDMFIPGHDRIEYYPGNSVGDWDIHLTWRLPADGHILHAYWQKLWEDGSGIGFQNGMDGLWGLEYTAPEEFGWISGVVVEYLDLTNQSGPIHWDPVLNPGTDLTSHTSGRDNYYNNGGFNGWANYGMSIGSPMVPSPLYNSNGQMSFLNNRIRGFHIGIDGHIGNNVDWRVLGGWRKGWGTYNTPMNPSRYDTSFMVEASWRPRFLNGLTFHLQGAMDHGTIYGNNLGAFVSASYHGNLTFGKK